MRFAEWRKACFLTPVVLSGILTVILTTVPAFAQASGSFIGGFKTISTVASTVPANGDQNPYGVVVVPESVGNLVQGDVLVSNFNNNGSNGGLQGTGTTIVQISPTGKVSLFARINARKLPGACPGGVGLTTALVVLQRGWVIVGSLPTSNGMAATAKAGCLIVLNNYGQAVETFSGGVINGPWDMTALDLNKMAVLFVTNVLNGTVAANGQVVNKGTVVRIVLSVPRQGYGMPVRQSTTVIGSGFAERTDPTALVVGPTGVGLASNNTLYVADSANSRIDAIPYALTRSGSAGTGNKVTSGGRINDPLGLTIAPKGDILTANGNDGNIVETTPGGSQIAHKLVDNTGGTGAGCLFGIAIASNPGVYFVDDCSNTLDLLH
ncbi:MAG TPA: hypothetical protein VKV40_24490 [Ktedonobacteraceae bacterium]|nr:hypothetical protein [Ktedonobacteraceae bacterium]